MKQPVFHASTHAGASVPVYFALLCFHRMVRRMLVYHTGRRTSKLRGWLPGELRGQAEQYYIRVTGSMCFGVVGWLTTGSALDSTLFA